MREPKDIQVGEYTLAEILERHQHWLNEDCEGWEDMRADLSYTDLRYTNLSYTDLRYTNLSCADLSNTRLSEKENIRKGIKLPKPMIGWKKCKNNVIVKLEIPRGATVFSINNNKCRTDKAKVLEIIGSNRAYSKHKFFSYYVGDIIEVFDFNCEYNKECAEGIHFFKTKEEAERY